MFQIQNNPLLLWVLVLASFVVVLGLIPVLQTLPPRGRRFLIGLFTFFAGAFFAVEFFLPVNQEQKNQLTDYVQPAQNMIQVIQALALGLGTYGLIRLHLRNTVQRRGQWGYSVVLLVSFVVMAIVSVTNTLKERGLVKLEGAVAEQFAIWYQRLFEYTLQQLDAAMFSIIAFYIFSAAYRAFRIRSIEAGILMFTAMIVMIGIVPLGGLIPFLPEIANTILTQLNAPVQRAIEFGIGIGGLAMALRLWLSLERGIT